MLQAGRMCSCMARYLEMVGCVMLLKLDDLCPVSQVAGY